MQDIFWVWATCGVSSMCILGFHMTSPKIQTKELSILLSFHFHKLLQQLDTFF